MENEDDAYRHEPSDSPIDAVIGYLRSFEQRLEQRALRAEERADVATARIVELEQERRSSEAVLAEAEERARALTDQARRDADALLAEARAEREQMAVREREFVGALRTYLSEIDEAQATLLRVARRALSATVVQGDEVSASQAEATNRPDVPAPLAPAPAASPAADDPYLPLGPPAAATVLPDRASDPASPAVPPLRTWSPPTPGTAGSVPPEAGLSEVVPSPDGDAAGSSDALVAFAPEAEHTTDEHRLIDLHNRLDLDRIYASSGPRSFFRR